jgi:L-ascorbate metabolism protein UlaG (beta-lactamase superfamily)
MIVSYLGHACFKLRGKKTTLVTDPYDQSVFGKLMPKTKADIVTISHAHHDHSYTGRIIGNPFIIRGPGEYEIKGVEILGIPSFHDKKQGSERGTNTIYIYRMDGLKLCHLGDLGQKLTDKQIEKLDSVDVLMIPVGGVYTIDAKEAVSVIEQLEPAIVIPMHFKTKDLTFKLDPLDKFLEEVGLKDLKAEKSLTVSASSLPEEREIIWLKK